MIERQNLQNLLRERQIILDMRKRYLGEEELNREALPALKFAGVLIEGAITGFDTNRVTGGAGARYLGIGAFSEYREDAVSVYLRAVSVKTGEVLISISTEQRIASVAMQGNAFKFVSFQELLEVDAGITMNQPRHLAVRQAFEKAVYGMIVEGAELGLWSFADQQAGYAAINHYRATYAPNLDSATNNYALSEIQALTPNVVDPQTFDPTRTAQDLGRSSVPQTQVGQALGFQLLQPPVVPEEAEPDDPANPTGGDLPPIPVILDGQ